MASNGAKRRLKARLAAEQCGICPYCMERLPPVSVETIVGLNPKKGAVLDHVVPRHQGGSLGENAAAVHYRCNDEKGPLPLLVFLALRTRPGELARVRKAEHTRLNVERAQPPYYAKVREPSAAYLRRETEEQRARRLMAEYDREKRATLADVWPTARVEQFPDVYHPVLNPKGRK